MGSARSTGRVLAFTVLLVLSACASAPRPATDRPNVVVILADDVGFADPGIYGGHSDATPELDRLAADGLRFNRFYMPAAACSPSRAGLLTGRYPVRTGILWAIPPRARVALDTTEVTIAELLRDRGYATAAIGKWHLGDRPDFFPTRQGFDSWFGLPYSNDMSPVVANNPRERARRHPMLPLVRDTTVVEYEPDQAELTDRYTQEAVRFIRQNADRPFFLYFAHLIAHVPLHPSAEYEGTTGGTYQDVLRQLDASVAAVRQALEEVGVERNTLVVVTSDNGPWLVMGDHAGSAGPLREGKATTFEGGFRVPGVAWWPGTIEAGSVSDAFVSALDLLPTVAALAGVEPPRDRPIDGRDWSQAIVSGTPIPEDDRPFFYYDGGALQAVRVGRYKLHLPHAYGSMDGGTPGVGGMPGETVRRDIGSELFDLVDDQGETRDVSAEYPDVVNRLLEFADSARIDLGDTATGIVGTRAPGPARIDSFWTAHRALSDTTGVLP